MNRIQQFWRLKVTHDGGLPLGGEPKYFTGLLLERWPEYLADARRAYRCASRPMAKALRSYFAEVGILTEIEPIVAASRSRSKPRFRSSSASAP